jgi:hypothetical protein
MSGSNPPVSSILEFSSDIADAKPPLPLPIGPYRGEIVSAQWRTAASTGNVYAAFGIRIPESEYPADFPDGEPDGTLLTYNRLLHGDTPRIRYAWRTFSEKVGAPLGRTIDLNNYLGLTVHVDVNHNEYEGETRAQIARILAP